MTEDKEPQPTDYHITLTERWSIPAVALVALMRRHNMTELFLTDEELTPEGGVVFYKPSHALLFPETENLKDRKRKTSLNDCESNP